MLDLQPLVFVYKTDPYTFTNLPPGDHQLMVELVNNDHSSLTPPVVAMVRFRVNTVIPVTGAVSGVGSPIARSPVLYAALLIVAGGLLTLLSRLRSPKR